uniref:BCD1 alpha/beta domain-containing protein n=1 Tax=Gouania willdenowi TaxID=441366 RepID=A0A8C5GKZ0_GOUWI
PAPRANHRAPHSSPQTGHSPAGPQTVQGQQPRCPPDSASQGAMPPTILFSLCIFFSLLCVKKHKEVSGCSGVRDKTGFVTLSHFDEMALLNDYRFLEDTGRFANSASRDNLLKSPRTTFKVSPGLIAVFMFSKSDKRAFLCFSFREKKFLWHLKLVFPQSSSEFSQRRVPDTHTLEQILNAYIHPTESDPVKRQRLKMYALTPFNHIKVFMKAEGRKGNSVRYHEMEMQKSLRDNLSYKTLIEYPVLHVVLRDHWEDFPLKGTGNTTISLSHVSLHCFFLF